MKTHLPFFIFLLIACSCNSSKKVVEESSNSVPFDESIIIEDTVTVNNGKLIKKTLPQTPVTTDSIIESQPNQVEMNVFEEIENDEEEDENDGIQLIPKDFVVNHDAWDTLLKQHVSSTGVVNYQGFKSNRKKLLSYINSLSENLPEDGWDKEEKLAYWMNAYNAMTVDLILRHWPVESIKDIKNPWEQRYWKLGDKYYNLDEIEHQILRKMGDPRIHFGINCASFSCPPLLNEAFTASKVDYQLNTLATTFINDTSRNMISENSVEISKIFSWFSKDFKTRGSIIDYLNKYSTVKVSEDAKVRYMDYNWELNN